MSEDERRWSGEQSAGTGRRADRYANRRIDRRTLRSRYGDAGYEQKPRSKPKKPRKRGIAMVVLLLCVIVILIAGLELTDEGNGVGGNRTTPFSLLPLDTGSVTATTATTVAGEPEGSSTTGSTTTTAAP